MTPVPESKRWNWRGDVMLVAGAAVFVYGLWLAWRPLGFIVAGLLIASAAFLSSYRPARSND